MATTVLRANYGRKQCSVGSCTTPVIEPENLLILWLRAEPSANDGEDMGLEDIPLVGFPSNK